MEILDVVKRVRRANARLAILARGEGPEECRLLEQHGVTRIINPELEAGLEMARQALLQLNLPATLVLREIEALRRLSSWNPLEILPEHEALKDLRNATALLQLEWLYIHEESPLAGKTLAESAIRREFGLSVVAIKRGEELFSNLDGAFQLLPEDYLAVVGAHDQNQRFLRTFSKKRE
jgi:CPA2 family monovalent cation:H+ antiporter-2